MKNGNACQVEKLPEADYTFEFYEDLNIVTDGTVGMDSCGNVEFITLNFNGKKVRIEGEAADLIFDAIGEAADNKRENIQAMEFIAAKEDEAEERFIRREEEKMMDRLERKGA